MRISWAPLGKLEKGTPRPDQGRWPAEQAGPICRAILMGCATRGHGYKAWKIPEWKWPLVFLMWLVIWNIFHRHWPGQGEKTGVVSSSPGAAPGLEEWLPY